MAPCQACLGGLSRCAALLRAGILLGLKLLSGDRHGCFLLFSLKTPEIVFVCFGKAVMPTVLNAVQRKFRGHSFPVQIFRKALGLRGVLGAQLCRNRDGWCCGAFLVYLVIMTV